MADKTVEIDDNIPEVDLKLRGLKEEYKVEKEKLAPKKAYKKKADVLKEEKFSQSAILVGSLALDIIVRRMPNPIPLTAFEKEAFDRTFSDLVKKYFQYISRFGEELAFGIVAITVLAPRLSKAKKEKVGTTDHVDIRKDGNREEHVSEEIGAIRTEIGNS